ncbi:hypothetical protein [Vibrio crassostreae]|uniref:hypothetical protein n=1 Tax=Vibrio crassostreae TaxID=246167 RepID=UPI001B3007ED|nr:hypothetical protein [Vibrio crassostreae]
MKSTIEQIAYGLSSIGRGIATFNLFPDTDYSPEHNQYLDALSPENKRRIAESSAQRREMAKRNRI